METFLRALLNAPLLSVQITRSTVKKSEHCCSRLCLGKLKTRKLVRRKWRDERSARRRTLPECAIAVAQFCARQCLRCKTSSSYALERRFSVCSAGLGSATHERRKMPSPHPRYAQRTDLGQRSQRVVDLISAKQHSSCMCPVLGYAHKFLIRSS